MSDMQNITVMGPAATSSDAATPVLNPPKFITNKTNKVQYRDAIMTWAEIVRSFAQADPKAKARLDMMGLIIYLACDDEAKAKLRAEETENRLILKGSSDDPNRVALIEKLLTAIAYETPSERIQREVAMLTDIHGCKRDEYEDTESYANKFEALVAKYVHQKNRRSPSDDQQWALLLLQNANLTADTLNSITFQLTAGAAMRKPNHSSMSVQVLVSDVQILNDALRLTRNEVTTEARNAAIITLQHHFDDLKKRAEETTKTETPTISFSEAVCALKQVHITPKNKGSMIATNLAEPGITKTIRKRSRIDEIKARTKCMACGRQGHWFKDNDECAKKMEAKLAEREKERQNERSDKMHVDDESAKKSDKTAFFRQRGQ